MPVIYVSMQAGRGTEVRAQLVRRINDVVTETLGVPAEKVWIYLDEYDEEHVAVGGKFLPGRAAKP